MQLDAPLSTSKEIFVVPPRLRWMIVAIIMLMMIGMFWMPFGLKTTDTQEGWSNLNRADEPGWFYLSNGRPFVMLPWEVSALLASDSFVGTQLVLIVLFLGKGMFLFFILRHLKVGDSLLAFLVAVLFVIYPADDGLFTLRAFGRHSAVFFFLLAFLLLVLASKFNKNIYLIFMALAQGIACFTAEAGALLSFVAPFVLLYFPNSSRHRRIAIAAIWYLILVMSLVFILVNGAGYQTMRFEQGYTTNGSFLDEVIDSNLQAYEHAYIFAWQQAFASLGHAIPYLTYAFVVTLVFLCGSWAVKRLFIDDEYVSLSSPGFFWLMLIVGFGVFGLGFFPYSLTDLRYNTWRVFYYSAIGASLFWGVIFRRITIQFGAWRDSIFIFIGSVLVFFSATHGLVQHADFVTESQYQQRVLGSITEQVPAVEPGVIFVFLVDSMRNRPFPNDQVVARALGWVYDRVDGNWVRGVSCYKEKNNCIFTNSGILIDSIAIKKLSREYDYNEVIIFSYHNDHYMTLLTDIPEELIPGMDVVGYDPYSHISYIPFPERPQKAFVTGLGPNPVRTAPEGWKGFNITMNDRRVCDNAHSGFCSLHLQGTEEVSSKFSQEVEFDGEAGQEIGLDLWNKISEDFENDIPVQVLLKILYANGTISEHRIFIEALTTEWRFFSIDLIAEKPFSHIMIDFESGRNAGSIWFDDIELMIDSKLVPILNPSFER